MDVLTFETCWAVNSEIIKQVTSGINLVYLYSTIKMMHGPINLRSTSFVHKNRHYYVAILLLHHIQKWKFVSHHNLASWLAEVTFVIENMFFSTWESTMEAYFQLELLLPMTMLCLHVIFADFISHISLNFGTTLCWRQLGLYLRIVNPKSTEFRFSIFHCLTFKRPP